MPSKPLLVAGALVLVSPLACSETGGGGQDGEGGGGSAGLGGAMPAAGSPASGGTPSGGAGTGGSASGSDAGGSSGAGAGSGGSAGMAGIAGIAGDAGMAGTAGDSGEDGAFVPAGLPNAELNGEGGLTLIAFTLRDGPTGLELYAAARNDGDTPACNPGMLIDFYDDSDTLLTSAGLTLSSSQYYRLDNGTGVAVTCVPPGDIGMAYSTTISSKLVVDDFASLQHSFPAFGVPDIVPIDALALSDVTVVARGNASAFTGTLTNELDVAVGSPEVTIFPVNAVGRPLGAARAADTTDIAPGMGWSFETGEIDDPGAAFVAFPSATVP